MMNQKKDDLTENNLRDYYSLIEQEKLIKFKKYQHKKMMHKKFMLNNKKAVQILDIIFVLMILCNFGALILTNYAVIQTKVELQQPLTVYEVNPVQIKINHFEAHPRSNQLFYRIMRQLTIWFFIMSMYIFFRRTVFTEEGFHALQLNLILLFVFVFYDLINDLSILFFSKLLGG